MGNPKQLDVNDNALPSFAFSSVIARRYKSPRAGSTRKTPSSGVVS